MTARRCPWAQVPAAGLLTSADAARVLKVSDRMVRYWAGAGELVGVQTWSGQWVFTRADVEAFWRATGGRMVRPRATSTQLVLPMRASKIRRPTPRPWTWATFRPVLRMAKAAFPDPEVNQVRSSRGKRHVA
jgi:excisionase family DNA binding protein